ncbi:hypothetical protein JB92DRAFT_3045819, partial [Gautieria morchelliformis]
GSTWSKLPLLYLALLQTRGASYVDSVHLHAHIAKHEVVIEASLRRIMEKMWRWVMMRVGGLWIASGQAEPAGPTQLACTLWQTYGRALTALLHALSNPPSPPSSPSSHLHPQSLPSTSSSHRTQPSYPYAQPPSQPPPHDSELSALHSRIHIARRLYSRSRSPPPPNSHYNSAMPRVASSTYRLAPGDERGRDEEIRREEIESVDEGEDVGDGRGGAGASSGSWWSWWRDSRGGYERVKTE